MITAKEVREITRKQNSTIEKILEELNGFVMLSSYSGAYSMEVIFDTNDISNRLRGYANRYQIKQNPCDVNLYDLRKKLEELGYVVNERTLCDFHISWKGGIL